MIIEQISLLVTAVSQLLMGIAAIAAPFMLARRRAQPTSMQAIPSKTQSRPKFWVLLMGFLVEGGFFVIIGLVQGLLVLFLVKGIEEWSLESLFYALLYAINAHVSFGVGLILLSVLWSSNRRS